MIKFLHMMTDYIRSGGVIMIPLLLVSFCMWVLIINRIMFMHTLYIKNISRKQAGEFIKNNTWPDEKYQGANSRLIREFLLYRSFDRTLDNYILDETVLKFTASLDKYLSIITVLSAVAPLLGLLGTVVGMMVTFDVITVFGTGNARAMAGGISVALITTQTGLMVSIPGLYMSGWLRRRAQNLKNRISATGIYLKRYL
ncbi:MAG: MotA/TolQ/ExbB proton channel family protein [Proteobacteria bacterium]|nr:MotA/TolQ/ExbB proton channel family protein [Pseudomonadota bacterium]MBU1386437.1 MotA/TolQ/ExbB proton channel family protein [Pseudomonadota bacterium]MBU1544548.1 MotA/TolQ/ExbB proton channel family protein [Pseudomonadota bacterium]MBU2480998.1 MotA/TolQ/ExbB proton channel family protein [Pseudomonadota bacterium]